MDRTSSSESSCSVSTLIATNVSLSSRDLLPAHPAQPADPNYASELQLAENRRSSDAAANGSQNSTIVLAWLKSLFHWPHRSVYLADGTENNCKIRERESVAVVTGCFLHEFGHRDFGHNPLPVFRAVLDLEDEAGIKFNPDLCFGNGTITFSIPTIVTNQAGESAEIPVAATYEFGTEFS
jgi:hypothetical protein